MTRPLVLLRPQPGNDASAMRARALGLDVVQAPLFEIVAAAPEPMPEGPFDAMLVTSANGARFGADALARVAGLPIYAVGEATAQAVRGLGPEFARADVIVGGGDAAATLPLIAAAGHRSVLHVCGADIRPFDPLGLTMVRHIVYRAVERAGAEIAQLLDGIGAAVLAIHSPRAGSRIAALIEPARRGHFHLLAISPVAAAGSGNGWASLSMSERPDDTALLTLAETLCNCGD